MSLVAYWDKRPCNVRHSWFPTGSPQWSRAVTERKYRVEPHIRRFADFPAWNHARVLELGCGIGSDTLEFAREGAIVTAVDFSPKSLQLARSRMKPGMTATFHCGNIEQVDLPGWYDLVYSFGVIHHTEHPEQVFQRAWEHLIPGGQFRFMVYAKWSLKFLTGQQPEAQAGCPIVRTYTARKLRRQLQAVGFEVVSIQKDHIFPYRVPEYVQYKYVKHWYYRWLPQPIFHLLERVAGHHLLVVARKPVR